MQRETLAAARRRRPCAQRRRRDPGGDQDRSAAEAIQGLQREGPGVQLYGGPEAPREDPGGEEEADHWVMANQGRVLGIYTTGSLISWPHVRLVN